RGHIRRRESEIEIVGEVLYLSRLCQTRLDQPPPLFRLSAQDQRQTTRRMHGYSRIVRPVVVPFDRDFPIAAERGKSALETGECGVHISEVEQRRRDRRLRREEDTRWLIVAGE